MKAINVIYVITYFLAAASSSIMFLHMFQLNSYKPKVQLKWLKSNKLKLCPLAIIFLYSISTVFYSEDVSVAFLAAMLLIYAVLYNPVNIKNKAKVKLAYTKRIQRMLATICALYVICVIFAFLLLGDLKYAFTSLALSLSFYVVLLANIINTPVEKAICDHYIADAKRMLNEHKRLTVIGVTGSYGKTSVKYYLYSLLKTKYNVLMTPQSYNTPMGIVKTIRGELKATHDIFICEMGARNVGDIKEICDIVHPDMGVITSIGEAHLESFKTIENTLKTKFELRDSLGEDGVMFVNGNNTYIKEYIKKDSKTRYMVYTTEGEGDTEGFDINVGSRGTEFKVRTADKQQCVFDTRLIGINNVINILGAICVCTHMGIKLCDLVLPVRKLQSVPHRLQMLERGDITIIDDAYNSNPAGSKSALETLALFDGYRILITPGMVELGDKQYKCNYEFGRQAAGVCDFILLTDRKNTQSIIDGLTASNYPREQIYEAGSFNEAYEKARAISLNGDKHKYILLENDLPDNY